MGLRRRNVAMWVQGPRQGGGEIRRKFHRAQYATECAATHSRRTRERSASSGVRDERLLSFEKVLQIKSNGDFGL